MPPRNGAMPARAFLFYAEDLAMRALPAELPRPQRKVMWTILQLHFGDPAVHFELQPQPSRGRVELGLHFEGPPEANDAAAAFVAARAADLIPTLGPAWELEAWTASWRRLHRTFPFDRLDEDLARQVGLELTRALVILHPVVTSISQAR
jgi:hypothetical protein